MRKPDEIALAREMLTYDPCDDSNNGQSLHIRMGIPVKRWRYILDKWNRRGWLEYVDDLNSEEFQCFNYAGYRYWSNTVSTCESVDATCDSTGAHPTCCTPLLYGLVASFNGGIIRECTIPLLE